MRVRDTRPKIKKVQLRSVTGTGDKAGIQRVNQIRISKGSIPKVQVLKPDPLITGVPLVDPPVKKKPRIIPAKPKKPGVTKPRHDTDSESEEEPKFTKPRRTKRVIKHEPEPESDEDLVESSSEEEEIFDSEPEEEESDESLSESEEELSEEEEEEELDL